MDKRIEYFDLLRGLAIIAVVAIHSTGSGLQFEANSFNFNFTVLWRNSLNFSVPLFIAISGYFLANKKIINFNEYLLFLKKQIPRVYIPFFVWSIVWLILAVLIFNRPIFHEVVKLITFQSWGPYYFIALIIQFYLLLPILKRFATPTGLFISVITSITVTIIIGYLRYYTDIQLPLILYGGNFGTFLMFFVLGLYLGKTDKINISNKLLIVSIFIFYVLSCVESYALIAMYNQAGDAVTAGKPSSFMYSFTLIIFLFKNIDIMKSNLMNNLGKMSFGIYLIHGFAMIGAGKLLYLVYPSLKEISPIYQFSLICITILLCISCISISNRLIFAKQNRLLGFK
jgi:surface polysaccharide O-acyltransferase-like enzyme